MMSTSSRTSTLMAFATASDQVFFDASPASSSISSTSALLTRREAPSWPSSLSVSRGQFWNVSKCEQPNPSTAKPHPVSGLSPASSASYKAFRNGWKLNGGSPSPLEDVATARKSYCSANDTRPMRAASAPSIILDTSMPFDSFQPLAMVRMPRSAVPDSEPYITATFIVCLMLWVVVVPRSAPLLASVASRCDAAAVSLLQRYRCDFASTYA